ncbi:hypothetical protein ASE75_12580 [Sphingomonas sp. Leaf17]|nr:hypothetical protein ASE75_12580 [Sphingomonas sp. Leaf17]
MDVMRGVAVMGIVVANLPAFALPEAAYFNPTAWGQTSLTDTVVWYANFVLIEGKMRGLFSLLFGASMLLVIDRARASGATAASVHFRRMAVLFVIGCAHLYLLWWGDILAHYALVGAIAYPFARLSAGRLVAIGLVILGCSTVLSGLTTLALFDAAPRATPDQIATWDGFALAFGHPPASMLAAEIDAFTGDWWTGVAWRWHHATNPLDFLQIVGPETLSAMLFGISGYRSGFLTGEWTRARYRQWAIVGLAIALPAYALLGAVTMAHGFDQRWIVFGSIFASEPVRVAGFVGYAALLMLVIRPGGRLTTQIAATGRAAFTNYIATSLLMTFVFQWGLGHFGAWPRAQVYALAPSVWLLMLAWSKPWLDRYRYGPMEWVWRSLSRWSLQPMRRTESRTNRSD